MASLLYGTRFLPSTYTAWICWGGSIFWHGLLVAQLELWSLLVGTENAKTTDDVAPRLYRDGAERLKAQCFVTVLLPSTVPEDSNSL